MKHQKGILWVIIACISIVTAWGEVTTIDNTNNSISGHVVWSDTVHVHATVTIQDRSTLEIRPGTKVLFRGAHQILVAKEGKIQAVGTEADTILFDAPDYPTSGVGWKGIRFDYGYDEQDTILFAYCHFQHIAIEDWNREKIAAIRCYPAEISHFKFSHCTFSHNVSTSFSFTLIDADSLAIEHAAFYNNRCVNMIATNASWTIRQTRIVNNEFHRIINSDFLNHAKVEITNCLIANNKVIPRDRGNSTLFYLWGGNGRKETLHVRNTIVYNNRTDQNEVPIFCYNGLSEGTLNLEIHNSRIEPPLKYIGRMIPYYENLYEEEPLFVRPSTKIGYDPLASQADWRLQDDVNLTVQCDLYLGGGTSAIFWGTNADMLGNAAVQVNETDTFTLSTEEVRFSPNLKFAGLGLLSFNSIEPSKPFNLIGGNAEVDSIRFVLSARAGNLKESGFSLKNNASLEFDETLTDIYFFLNDHTIKLDSSTAFRNYGAFKFFVSGGAGGFAKRGYNRNGSSFLFPIGLDTIKFSGGYTPLKIYWGGGRELTVRSTTPRISVPPLSPRRANVRWHIKADAPTQLDSVILQHHRNRQTASYNTDDDSVTFLLIDTVEGFDQCFPSLRVEEDGNLFSSTHGTTNLTEWRMQGRAVSVTDHERILMKVNPHAQRNWLPDTIKLVTTSKCDTLVDMKKWLPNTAEFASTDTFFSFRSPSGPWTTKADTLLTITASPTKQNSDLGIVYLYLQGYCDYALDSTYVSVKSDFPVCRGFAVAMNDAYHIEYKTDNPSSLTGNVTLNDFVDTLNSAFSVVWQNPPAGFTPIGENGGFRYQPTTSGWTEIKYVLSAFFVDENRVIQDTGTLMIHAHEFDPNKNTKPIAAPVILYRENTQDLSVNFRNYAYEIDGDALSLLDNNGQPVDINATIVIPSTQGEGVENYRMDYTLKDHTGHSTKMPILIKRKARGLPILNRGTNILKFYTDGIEKRDTLISVVQPDQTLELPPSPPNVVVWEEREKQGIYVYKNPIEGRKTFPYTTYRGGIRHRDEVQLITHRELRLPDGGEVPDLKIDPDEFKREACLLDTQSFIPSLEFPPTEEELKPYISYYIENKKDGTLAPIATGDEATVPPVDGDVYSIPKGLEDTTKVIVTGLGYGDRRQEDTAYAIFSHKLSIGCFQDCEVTVKRTIILSENPTLNLQNLECYPEGDFVLLNRWGQRMLESTNPGNDIPIKTVLNPGIYFWAYTAGAYNSGGWVNILE